MNLANALPCNQSAMSAKQTNAMPPIASSTIRNKAKNSLGGNAMSVFQEKFCRSSPMPT